MSRGSRRRGNSDRTTTAAAADHQRNLAASGFTGGRIPPGGVPLPGEPDKLRPREPDPEVTVSAKDPSLEVFSTEPLNAQPPLARLDSAVTPLGLFFVRTHAAVPRL